MIKETVTYEDFNGNTVSEDLYFNFTRNELMEMESNPEGAMSTRMQQIAKSKNAPAAYLTMKTIILDAYGQRSEDGRRFIKTPEIRQDFEHSAACDEFLFQIFQDSDKMIRWVNEVVPRKAIEEAISKREGRKITLEEVAENPDWTPGNPIAAPAKRVKAERDERREDVGTFGQPVEKAPEPTPEQIQEYLRNNNLNG